MKIFSKITAVFLAVLMLSSAFATGAFAFPTNTKDTIAEEAEYDYFYKYDFDKIAAGSSLDTFYHRSPAESNPYGFNTSVSSVGTLPGVIKTRYDKDGKVIGNYLELNYAPTKTKDWFGARLEMTKDGKSYTIGNTLSAEFELRWQGVADTSKINESQVLSLLRFRRSSNSPSQLLAATIVAGEKIVDGQTVTVPDQYLKVYVVGGKQVALLDKDSDDFTKFYVVYYDATQTFSVYVDDKLLVEAKAATTSTNGKNDLREDKYINYTYDTDAIVTSREEASGDRLSFVFGRTDYTETARTPYILDIDNFYIREVELTPNRTAYYENTFEAPIGNLVDRSFSGSTAYTYNNTSNISTATETVNGEKNTYVTVLPTGRFNIKDGYQIIQSGNWTLEFDVRATVTSNNAESILRFYDTTNTPQLLHVDKNGTITFGSGKRTVHDIKLKSFESNEWTHIVISMNVDLGSANRGVNSNLAGSGASNSLAYQMSLWVDGKFAGTADLTRGELLFESNSSSGRMLDDKYYTRTALAEEPSLTGLTLLEEKAAYKQYIDEKTGNLYQIAYDENGNFVPGELGTGTNKAATGSVLLTYTGTTHGDLWGFFNNSSSATIKGAIDNIKIYEGVLPKEYATGKDATAGIVNELSFSNITTQGAVAATQSQNGGYEGVVRFNNWGSSIATIKDGYTTISSTSSERFFDIYTPNMGGKIYALTTELRNFKLKEGAVPINSIRRQVAGSTGNSSWASLKLGATGGIYFTGLEDEACYLYDKNGNQYLASADDWKKITTVVDETTSSPKVTYLVNGEVAYFKSSKSNYLMVAANIEGIFPAALYEVRDAVDQRLRILQSAGEFSLDLRYSGAELVENPLPLWEDSAMINFADYDSIDDLSPQFYRTSGVYIEDGVLVIPAGETFAWIDYNKAFYHFTQNNTSVTGGFNVEARIKTDTTKTWLASFVHDKVSNNFVYFKPESNKIVVSGSLTTNAYVSERSDDEFTNLSATFWKGNNTTAATFIDGAMVGIAAMSNNSATESEKYHAFVFADDTEISELYIHADLKRELSETSRDIITIDPDILAAANSTRYVSAGIASMGPLNKHASITTIVEEDGDSFYRWSFAEGRSSHDFADIYLTDYLEDKAVVFEADFRFTPSVNATESNNGIELFALRKANTGGSPNFENLVTISPLGKVTSLFGFLCDESGNDIILSSDWHKIAVIYDSTTGLISYRLDGKIPYYHSGENTLLANEVRNTKSRLYTADWDETRLRTVSLLSNSLGTLDLRSIDIYSLDDSANIKFAGVQTANDSKDLRIVAALDMLYYTSAGFDVKAYDENGNLLTDGSKEYSTSTVYSSIAETVGGEVKNVYPYEYGGRYFLTANITGITSEHAVKLEITPFTKTGDVKKCAPTVTLKLDMTSDMADDWVCETSYVEIKPEGDNTNANFSTTEYVAYTNTGALELNGLDAQFAFAANCEGEVSLDIACALGEDVSNSKFDIYVDGVLTASGVTLEFGHHTLVLATDLEKDDHTFKIVKRSGGDYVSINSINLCGSLIDAPILAREGAVDVIIHGATGTNKLGNISVYVQTSEASGDYYILYNFNYEQKAPNSYDYTNGQGDTQDNKTLYRIVGADLVKKIGPSTYSSAVFGVLSTGEISLAIKEKWQNVSAKDFVGGFHGDEHITSVAFYADGVKLDHTKEGVYTDITQFEMIQETVINRCDTPATPVMNHNQKYLVSSNGIKLEQQVEFLVDDFQPAGANTYLEMATVYRVNTVLNRSGASIDVVNSDENLVCSKVNLLNANGEVTAELDVSADKYNYDPSLTYTKNETLGSDLPNRYIEYLGNTEGNYPGLYGLVGFVVDDGSVKCDSSTLAVRLRQGDNKWYASFDTYNGTVVPKGEVWNVSNSYFFDYNPALYGTNN